MALRPWMLRCSQNNVRSIRSLPSWQRHFTSHSSWSDDEASRDHDRRAKRQTGLVVLAIETSCDDTSVAILERQEHTKHINRSSPRAAGDRHGLSHAHKVIFHEKITANNDAYNGIHPLVALESHRSNLSGLVQRALKQLRSHDQPLKELVKDDRCSIREAQADSPNDYENAPQRTPDLVAVTRGPGMRSNLAVGLDTAKGLAVAWDVPLVGVHHMQAHALTPRLVHALESSPAASNAEREGVGLHPKFPFMSVLVSGGHTLLIDSRGLTDHALVAETQDIAIGDCLDKAARVILPATMLKAPFGRALEQFAFHTSISATTQADSLRAETQNVVSQAGPSAPPVSVDQFEPSTGYDYKPPATRQDELEYRPTQWGWSLGPPLSESNGREKSSRRMMFSFAGLLSFVERIIKYEVGPQGNPTTEPRSFVDMQERQTMAREVQRVAFEHLASRIMLFLESRPDWAGNTVVVSGGVASSRFLRHLFRSVLDARGYKHIKLSFPPVELCTDNALMIAWAGLEMFNAGYTSDLSIGPIRKWSLDPKADDGGILGAEGWLQNGHTERSAHR
ncbi:tRNA N6-adenosine threonylcarbamoyltransferase, mitochondrial [Teratosphaeria destructans]|uniref:tRNA N6-adenosine threonylcarbamoyltransferase, mitochondrial n=1 Tax=Teratosphaeria destructans TaxID=418781 RepID=A0A9W7W4S6_9PEZI|nr:tRNA N6-adenosine threonylcarbamoyltransferase, mitochondrial [Teratosphaeria destructans]